MHSRFQCRFERHSDGLVGLPYCPWSNLRLTAQEFGVKPEQKQVAMSEDEKAVFNLLKVTSPADLNTLKQQSGLSNKKWDKTIKGLTKHNLLKVEKTSEGLLVTMA